MDEALVLLLITVSITFLHTFDLLLYLHNDMNQGSLELGESGGTSPKKFHKVKNARAVQLSLMVS